MFIQYTKGSKKKNKLFNQFCCITDGPAFLPLVDVSKRTSNLLCH